ncbi:MAG: AMP-binding protein, partial [bacterium]
MPEPLMPEQTPYRDTFARDNLPPRELWPEMDYSVLSELDYPESLNCAAELLDRFVEAGGGERIVFRGPGGVWRYGELLEKANRIANVLTGELGLRPGNRVLLRGPNHPMLAACWFAVVKAGGICVATMPLLRARELSYVVEKAEIRLAVCDRRWAEELETARVRTPQLEQVVYFNCEEEPKGRPSLETMASKMPDTFANAPTRADDVAMIAFTSGTTGQPKSTMHFHRDVMAV